MFCELLLPINTTATGLFKPLNDFISEKLICYFVSVYAWWEQVNLMNLSFTTWITEATSENESRHCFIHRKHLLVKKRGAQHVTTFCRV